MFYRFLILMLLLCVAGCATEGPRNPSFPVTADEARRILREERRDGKTLERPVVVIGGFLDPGIAARILAGHLRVYTGDHRIISVSPGMAQSFKDIRSQIIEAVDRAFPTSDPEQTAAVDVVGYSMGGLAARYAAMELPASHSTTLAAKGRPIRPRRLRIVRLFTISSPLRGANTAADIPLLLHPLQGPMIPGSSFIRAIDDGPMRFENVYSVYSYVRLGDDEIGESNAAVMGQTAWWVSTPAGSPPHEWAFQDARILADIVRRLKNKTPLTSDPATAVPVLK